MLIFVGVPLIELLVILQVGEAIGGWLTAALLIADSVLGALLLRYEGRRAWSEFRRALGEGRWPGDEVAQGALIIVGGTLLVTPGFVTDVVGFLLLLSPSRRLVARGVRARMDGAVITGGVRGDGASRGSTRGRTRPGRRHGSSPSGADEGGLDVEVVEIRREQPPLRDRSPTGDVEEGPDTDGVDDDGR